MTAARVTGSGLAEIPWTTERRRDQAIMFGVWGVGSQCLWRRWRLRSENSEEHQDEIYPADSAAKIKVLGWVFWWSTVRKWRGR